MTSIASTSRLPLTRTMQRRAITAALFASQQCRHASTSSSTGSTPSTLESLAKSQMTAAGRKDELSKQLDALKRMQNMKTPAPIQTDTSIPFAVYTRPRNHGFRLFSEQWLIYQGGRALNWYKGLQDSQKEYGLWAALKPISMKGPWKDVVHQDLIPLYQQICEAYSSNDIPSSLHNRISRTLSDKLAESANTRDLKGLKYSWQWHVLKSVNVECIRLMESEPGIPQMQMTLWIESLQSLETFDARTDRLLSGSHSSPKTVIENMVFQRRTSTADQPWIAINTIPTLTPLQSIGRMDRDLLQIVERKKRTRLTVVA